METILAAFDPFDRELVARLDVIELANLSWENDLAF